MSKVKKNSNRSNANTLNARNANSLSVSGSPFTPSAPSLTMRIPELIGKYTATSGAVSGNTQLTAALITNFATRFAAFDEYRILCFDFEIMPVSANTGTAMVWVEPLSNSAPTTATAQSNIGSFVNFHAACTKTPYKLRYAPTDSTLIGFQPISTTTFGYGYLKVFTNAADFASLAGNLDIIVVRAMITIQFRGLA